MKNNLFLFGNDDCKSRNTVFIFVDGSANTKHKKRRLKVGLFNFEVFFVRRTFIES